MLSAATSIAQEYKNGIGVHFKGLDFYGPQSGHYFFQNKLNSSTLKNETKLFWDPSIRVSYWHFFNKYFDLNAGINAAALQYPATDKDSMYIKAKSVAGATRSQLPYLAADAKVNFNILERGKYLVSPYATVGLGVSFHQDHRGIDLPLGLGANIDLGKGVFFNMESNYFVAISKVNQNHLSHSIGLVYWLKSVKTPQQSVAKLPEPPIAKDTDNDGIPDKEDACPTLPGKREMKGCPDKDNDGIVDSDDLCPDVKGLKQFGGCPDTDGDGIPDQKDACPDLAGLVKYKGCPVPDTDHDGFNDELDKCPEVYSAVNQGCPEVKKEDKEKIDIAAQGIYFETGSAVIKKTSFANLDKIVAILNAQPTYNVEIEGHTDNSGNAENNLVLSQERADACGQYLKGKGITSARIASKGYGDTSPVGDNATPEGRSKNRRTEFKIKSY
ncbi:outer membrane porin F [Filimonas sp.]|nr:outer membrane porin F [Filimonas sp.]